MNKIKIAIIDDEENARIGITEMLNLNFDRPFELIYAHSVLSGMKLLTSDKPDVLLLDIQMDDGTGFDILDVLSDRINCPIIFTTAHDNHALRAFKHNAIDYLLKPINSDDLISALERAIKQIGSSEMEMPAKGLVKSYKFNDYDSVVFNTQRELRRVKVSNIAYITAESNFCFVYLLDGEKLTVPNTLKEYEQMLPQGQFYRTHKSFLVNLECIISYVKKDGGYLQLAGNLQVPLSKRNKQEFLKRMKAN